MDREALKNLDFYRIIDQIGEYCHSEATRELIKTISPFDDLDSITRRFGQVREIKRLREDGTSLPLYPFEDISEIIDRVKPEGAALDPDDLLKLLPVLRLFEEISEVNKRGFLYLGSLLDSLSGFYSIRLVIERTIDNEGKILDSASPILEGLRNERRLIEKRIKKRLEDLITDRKIAPFLQDSFISMRSGRWVIPVRMDSKGEVKGIVHDVSRSGDTAFIEPVEIIGPSNELENIIAEERVEELRILRGISDLIRAEAEEIRSQFKILLEIDLLNSIVLFSERINAQIPEINESGFLRLHRARHPVLPITKKEDEVIPLDIEISESERVFVITGPNAGGKTVAVKTVGLLTAMALSGIPIPAEPSSSIPLIRDIYVDIGDEQSILDNLSTFSGHIKRISDIISRVSAGDMVIIDELGTGTDPSQGASLGCAILEELRNRGALVFATTHLIDIVGFVYAADRMINASMEFDYITLNPLYRLKIGEPGQSYALEIAAKYGLSEDIINRAKKRLGKGTELYNLLNELKDMRGRYEDLIREEESRIKQLREQEERVQRMLEFAEREKREIIRKAYEEAREIVIDIRRRLNHLMEETKVKKADIILKEITGINRRVEENIRSLSSEPLMDIEGIKEGDMIFVRSAGKDLRVAKVFKDKRTVKVRLRNMEFEIPLEYVFPPRGSRVETPEGDYVEEGREVQRDLNVMGLRVEEAIQRLESFLNDAFLSGIREVRVIHGFGKGVLLKAVRDYLGRHELVEGFSPAEGNLGGDGVTVVKMASRY